MLNVFPSLLIPFFAPALLRVVVALTFWYLAYKQYARRDEIAALSPTAGALVWGAIAFNILVGAMLLFGYYTQVAALLGVLGQLFGLWANKRYPSVVILPNAAVLLLIAICLSLILSGAGAFAQDLPL